MIRLLWTASAEVRYFLRCYMPSNILLDLIRTRKGLKWGVPAMGLGVVYLLIAAASITLINGGWSQGLYIIFVLCLWNALKFLLFGPISLMLLARARVHEHRAKRDLQRSSADAVAA